MVEERLFVFWALELVCEFFICARDAVGTWGGFKLLDDRSVDSLLFDCSLFFFRVPAVLVGCLKFEELCFNALSTTDDSDFPRFGSFSLEGCSGTKRELLVFFLISVFCLCCMVEGLRLEVGDLPMCDVPLIDDFFTRSFGLEGDMIILHLLPTISSS